MPIKLHGREQHFRMIVTAIYRYAKRYNAWPSLAEVVRVGKEQRLGTTSAVYPRLRTLQETGILFLQRKGEQSGWKITEQGYDWLKRPALRLMPALAVRRRDRTKRHKVRAKSTQVKSQLHTDSLHTFDRDSTTAFPFVPSGEYGDEHVPVFE